MKMSHLNWTRVKLSAGSDRGSVLLLTAFCMIVLLGMIGLALDTGNLYNNRRAKQSAADAAALAGASEIYRAQTSYITTSARDASAYHGFTHGTASTVVTVSNPPVNGYFVGNIAYVEVVVTQPARTFFMGLFGFNSLNIPARAVAGVGAKSKNCVYVLDPTREKAFKVNSSSSLSVNCGIQVNSNDGEKAMNAEGSTITATNISVTGEAEIQSSTVTPPPKEGAPREVDPLASLPNPSYGAACNYNNKQVSGTETLSPGVYCGGIKVSGSSARATFSPGIYILNGGGLQVESQARITGSEVMFFNTGGDPYQPIRIQSSTHATLSAPTSGAYEGILFFQDRTAGKPGEEYTNLIQSSGTANFTGVMYFATQFAQIGWSSTTTTINGGVVARTVEVASSSNVLINSYPTGPSGQHPLKRISLVE